MQQGRLKGKRYICLARASDDKEGTTSTEAQLATMREKGDREGGIHVDDMVRSGMTGSLPGKRKDLDALLKRKREANDFEALLVQKIDRMTRGGAKHLLWFEFECDKAGITVVYTSDDLPQGRHTNLIKVALADAAQETAISTSLRSTQGYQFALENNRVATFSHTPYGCWRLYTAADGTPLHIIRDLRDGRQQKLHPHTHEIIDTYGNIGGGSKGHYRKQKHELVFPMPGDPQEQQVVREIFDLHFLRGWGGKRIADLLNGRGILSPQGKQWSQRQVEVIYEQEVYTGLGIANRTSSAIYYQRNHGNPMPVELDPQILANAENLPVRYRPREEWEVKEYPMMADFLDPQVRALARAAHEEIWRRRLDPNRVPMSKSKHRPSDYLLTGLFTAKQDGESLVGILCGPADKRVRYYRHRRSRRGYRTGSLFNGMFNASALETAVLELVREVLLDTPDLKRRIVAMVEDQQAALVATPTNLEKLRQEREEIRKEVERILAVLDDETLADAKRKLDALKPKRRALDLQIAAAEAAASQPAGDAETLADEIIRQIEEITDDWSNVPRAVLRGLLASIVEKIEGDMVTKNVEITLKLPSWSMKKGSPQLRLVTSSESRTSDETQRVTRIIIATAKCSYAAKVPVCYTCRRQRAA